MIISYTLQLILIGSMLIGSTAGVLSVFFVTRQQSILGDAIAHASIAGVMLGYLLVLDKIRSVLLLGAIISAFLSLLMIYLITEYTPLKQDAAIGISLTSFFGLGIVILTHIQNLPGSSRTGLKSFLFGNITFLLFDDIPVLIGLAVFSNLTVFLFWKEFKLLVFDRDLLKTQGYPVIKLDLLLILLVTIATVIGIELIGTVMMAGLLIGPALAARQWSDRFGTVVLLSAIIGALAGAIGSIFSAYTPNLPPGPTIIISLGVIVIFSILFARKGLVITKLSVFVRKQLRDPKPLLGNIAYLVDNSPINCDIREFETGSTDLNHDEIQYLEKLGYISNREGDRWMLTYKGMRVVETLRQGGGQ